MKTIFNIIVNSLHFYNFILGLGKQEQGINTCLQVEKTSKRGGKIINQDKGNPISTL